MAEERELKPVIQSSETGEPFRVVAFTIEENFAKLIETSQGDSVDVFAKTALLNHPDFIRITSDTPY